MMPSDHQDEILYIDNPNKSIFFYDRDIQLLKKLGGLLVDDYPKHEVIAFDNLDDFSDELLKTRPEVFILEYHSEEKVKIFDLIRSWKKDSLVKDIPIIFLGIRESLEEVKKEIAQFDIFMVPKAVRIPLFKSVVQTALTEANSMKVDKITLKQGENLFLQGDAASKIYITKKGQLEVYHSHDGEDFILGKIGEGEVVGEMAFLEGDKRSASVRALEEVEVLALDISNIKSYLSSQPFWLDMILHALVHRLREANQKLSHEK